MDLPAALKMVRGNDKLLRGLLIKFREGYLTYAEDIENALAKGEIEEAKRMAHSLKGVSGSLKAERVYLSACTLDAALRDSAEASEISPLVSDLSQALAEIQASLHSAL
ncbi:MAG: Hpt domain-containing protein [Alphaproteobacteria bacterium]